MRFFRIGSYCISFSVENESYTDPRLLHNEYSSETAKVNKHGYRDIRYVLKNHELREILAWITSTDSYDVVLRRLDEFAGSRKPDKL